MTQPVEFTDSSARFNLPFLFAGQAQKEFFVNQAHALTDMLLHTSVLGEATAPPIDPSDGDMWMVAASATGIWAGREGQLAGLQAGVWTFVAPADGMQVFDQTTGQFAIYSSGWIRSVPPVTPDSGQTVDSELRAAFGQLIEALRNAGIFPVPQ